MQLEPTTGRVPLLAVGALELALILRDVQHQMLTQMPLRAEALLALWTRVLVRIQMQLK